MRSQVSPSSYESYRKMVDAIVPALGGVILWKLTPAAIAKACDAGDAGRGSRVDRRHARIGHQTPPRHLNGSNPVAIGLNFLSLQGFTLNHELRRRLQVDPGRGLAAGMADPARSRRLLSPGRQLRHDRPHL